MVFNLFYVAGGGTVVFLVTGYILGAKQLFQNIIPFDMQLIVVVRAGVTIALVFYVSW